MQRSSLVFAVQIAACVCLGAFAQEAPHGSVLAKGVTAIRLKERGAHLAEGFDAPAVNTDVWRIWQMDPDKTTIGVRDGRLELEARGDVAHNGLYQIKAAKYKDVVLVARMDTVCTGAVPHEALLHLCGGEMPVSPDHWVEVAMADHGDTATFRVIAAVPRGVFTQADRVVTLPREGHDGFLVRLVLDGSTNRCTPEVKSVRGWVPITDPVELLLRTTHCEVKIRSGAKADAGAGPTRAWFDDVRIYPRPESHPVLLRLSTPDGSVPWSRGASGNAWPPVVTVAGKGERSIEDLVVELRTADGSLVSSVQSQNMGHYMLPVLHPDWDVFPVAAEVRILLDGEVLGEAVRIEQEGLAGLYPDDVWEVVVE